MRLIMKHKGDGQIVDLGIGFWCRPNERPIPTLCADSVDGKSQFDLEMTVAHCDRMIEQIQKLKASLTESEPPRAEAKPSAAGHHGLTINSKGEINMGAIRDTQIAVRPSGMRGFAKHGQTQTTVRAYHDCRFGDALLCQGTHVAGLSFGFAPIAPTNESNNPVPKGNGL